MISNYAIPCFKGIETVIAAVIYSEKNILMSLQFYDRFFQRFVFNLLPKFLPIHPTPSKMRVSILSVAFSFLELINTPWSFKSMPRVYQYIPCFFSIFLRIDLDNSSIGRFLLAISNSEVSIRKSNSKSLTCAFPFLQNRVRSNTVKCEKNCKKNGYFSERLFLPILPSRSTITPYKKGN